VGVQGRPPPSLHGEGVMVFGLGPRFAFPAAVGNAGTPKDITCFVVEKGCEGLSFGAKEKKV